MATDTMAAPSPSVSVPAAASNVNARNTTTTFSNGAIAPNTASPLPIYLATGLLTLSAGLLLLRRRTRSKARA
jgi:LPXTG-motif cell wall-anchored protein